ncbi:hypothetical protein TNCV_2728511 [Trichonephila clavipes]|nr:hypothetical protein TNCV_2728511 [Trichonephila clavipes]
MVSCLENSPCTTLVPFWPFKLVQSLVEASKLNFRNAFGVLRKYNSFNNVFPVHFLIDFSALFHKNQRLSATCTNSVPDFGCWRSSTIAEVLERPHTRFYRFGSYELVEP